MSLNHPYTAHRRSTAMDIPRPAGPSHEWVISHGGYTFGFAKWPDTPEGKTNAETVAAMLNKAADDAAEEARGAIRAALGIDS